MICISYILYKCFDNKSYKEKKTRLNKGGDEMDGQKTFMYIAILFLLFTLLWETVPFNWGIAVALIYLIHGRH
jgi:hypothetical protein